jgi:hypothetical protein
VLVKPDALYVEEPEALSQAEGDLNQAFAGDGTPAGARVAECLKALGYIKVEDFKIVDNKPTPVA